MNLKSPILLVFLWCIAMLMSCEPTEFIPNFDIDEIEGFAPIYSDSTQLVISKEPPRLIYRAGKIYSYGAILVVNERNEGFHVFDNSNPENPQNLFFISVPGNNDVAIKNGVVYADNYSDLVALEITADTVRVLKRLKNAIQFLNEYPPQGDSYFECIDPSKGIVVGWQRQLLSKPQCYRP